MSTRGGARLGAGSKPKYDGGTMAIRTTIPKKAYQAFMKFIKVERKKYLIK